MFNSFEAKQNGKRFRAECNRRMEKMFRSLGVSSLDDIIRQTEENVRKSKTCRLCGFYCTNYHTLEIHRNSQRCKRRQAEKKGEIFVPKKQTPKRCDICNKSVLFYNWRGHLESVAHKENVRKMSEPAFQCTVCDKVFKGSRQKQMLKRHMQSKKHLEKLKEPWNQGKHDVLIRKHFSRVKVV